MPLIPNSYRRDDDYLDSVRAADQRARHRANVSRTRGKPRQLDVAKLIRDLGGTTWVAQRLTQRGMKVTKGGVQKWIERSRMSSDWLAELAMIYYEDRGQVIDLREYVWGSLTRIKTYPKSLLE